ncbi:hypothetical protein KIL84_017509 [Mauremys mutica]|uniref:Uncharacterized protein n=1 Tax=Mauremys mutica TaxID=74926 RepID=A0A9D4AYQ3_9SAUR|nr:hypothetical protein KIL84_017509 [Mauremys mutica]
MAEAGEGEDEIQFLRTLITFRNNMKFFTRMYNLSEIKAIQTSSSTECDEPGASDELEFEHIRLVVACRSLALDKWLSYEESCKKFFQVQGLECWSPVRPIRKGQVLQYVALAIQL